MKKHRDKCTRDRLVIKLLLSPSIMVSASSVSKKFFSKTRFLSSDLNELCDGINLILQEKQAGKKFKRIVDEMIAVADILLEHKCISIKQQKFFHFNCIK